MVEFDGQKLLLKTGFAELYEYEDPTIKLTGRFVTFSKTNPDKIVACKNDDYVLGVVTIKPLILSNDTDEWHKKYATNMFGDSFVMQKSIARGIKQYNAYHEMDIIHTYKDVDYVGIVNHEFDSNKPYASRSAREEWVAVALLGQVIVTDNGKCNPGQYCMPYVGSDPNLFGTAVPASGISKRKFYVLNRVSETTINIVMK